MRFIFFILFFGVFIVFFFMLLWTNVTKGYYQRGCCDCEVEYLPADYEEMNCFVQTARGKRRIACPVINCEMDYLNLLKLKFGDLDAYR